MTDRELLEAAAMAAGIAVEWRPGCGNTVALTQAEARAMGRIYWNPIADDGDALRLAVKLHLVIDITPWATDCGQWNKYTSSGHTTDAYQSAEDDHAAATRRAIVRAAAALASQPAPHGDQNG